MRRMPNGQVVVEAEPLTYLNLKGYGEFDAQNRPSGWNTWLTLAISPAEKPTPMTRPMIHK